MSSSAASSQARLAGSLASTAPTGAKAGKATTQGQAGRAGIAASIDGTVRSSAPTRAATRPSAAEGVCATIDRYHLEKQMNAHAAQILASCGRAPSGPPTGTIFSSLSQITSSPDDYGGVDVNVVTGGEGASAHVRLSDGREWAPGQTGVAGVNDSPHAPA